MKKIILNESQLKKIIKESVKRLLSEDIDDIDDEIPVEDDWRSEEPSHGYVQSTLENIEQQCNACGATFKNLGDNEFGVIIKDANNSSELITTLKDMKERGIIYNTGGNIASGRIKFRIIKEIN